MCEFVDYIKIDFRALTSNECRELVSRFGKQGPFVAEKIETRAEYARGPRHGLHVLPGILLRRTRRCLPCGRFPPCMRTIVRLLAATCKPDFDFFEVEAIIKTDVALCYKLLRFLNSAAFCLGSDITSLRQALVILGENAIRRWVCVSAAATAAKGKPAGAADFGAAARTLLRTARRPCPHAVPITALWSGLFSLIERSPRHAARKHPASQVELPAESTKPCSVNPCRLRSLARLVSVLLQGDWDAVAAQSVTLDVSAAASHPCYLEAARSADSLMTIALNSPIKKDAIFIAPSSGMRISIL